MTGVPSRLCPIWTGNVAFGHILSPIGLSTNIFMTKYHDTPHSKIRISCNCPYDQLGE